MVQMMPCCVRQKVTGGDVCWRSAMAEVIDHVIDDGGVLMQSAF